MKYTDGLWQLRDGVKASFALDVQKVDVGQDSVSLKVASKVIRHRGDTLGGPLLSIEFTSPADGVIGVKTEHFSSTSPPKGPEYELFPDGTPAKPKITVKKEQDTIRFSSGPITAKINSKSGNHSFDFVTTDSNKILTSTAAKGQAIVDVPYKWTTGSASNSSCLATDPSSNPHPPSPPEVVRYIVNELNISPGELIYGFGEQFGAFIKNGQSISLWNSDGGTSSKQAYKNVPFYLTNKGYGIFINHSGEVEVEVGSEKMSRVSMSVGGESLQYFIIYGPSPKEVLERYTALTGRPGLPPAWSFGLWLTTSFLTDYNSQTVTHFLQGMKDRNCDVRVFHFDCFWMKAYEWCSFTFDPDNFPNPENYLRAIKEKYNVKVCLWINPYISSLSPIYKEGVDGGFFIKRTNGETWAWDLWQPGLAIVDFTNPQAAAWYTSKLEALLDLGVDTFKTDFGERIPHVEVKFHDGSEPYRMHNAYAQIYNKLVFGILEKRFGKNEAVVFARSATAGGQRFPVHWGGDCESTFEAMAETLRGGLSLTASGFGFTSHDIGGFEGQPSPALYMRWLGYGLFSSHSRLHGSSSYRVPWNYGEEASKVLAKFLDAKHRLMPYIYATAINAHRKGHPVQRATFFEFPSDRTSYYLDQQFMLGENLLVAPVFADDDEEVEFYVPAGTWTSFWSAEDVVQGPAWVKRKFAYETIPVYVRPNTLLALGKPGMRRPDYDFTKHLEIRVYGLPKEGDVATAVVPTGKGEGVAAILKASRTGGKVVVEILKGRLNGPWYAAWYSAGFPVREGVVKDGNKIVLG